MWRTDVARSGSSVLIDEERKIWRTDLGRPGTIQSLSAAARKEINMPYLPPSREPAWRVWREEITMPAKTLPIQQVRCLVVMCSLVSNSNYKR